ncbi:hypothetical protein Smp_097790.1 [Schistosoma mansoni]|uniref:Enhancer of mRNA-decapping protein 4 n=1 Tax=Schistosoma mansoni TaxID=6183 RepID=G4LXC9_SCHMA|nr:hypothetical protein Smp_097790.1 [Schistosoma mansoni]|eukprot:XP_018645918.1 hypothetical protein Smp_097790.1 [Schistosoma mansoni]
MSTKQCTLASKANKPAEWIACDKVVVRDQVRWQSLTSVKPFVYHPKTQKPTASVYPTPPVKPNSSTHTSFSPIRKADKEAQTDNNHTIIFNIEDIIRAQRNLASTNQNSLHLSSSDGKDDDKESLQKELELQQRINTDLKNLLVSALSGNLNVAQQLIDLMSSNAYLCGQSEGLARQKSLLQEAADTAEIVADVWQTKCIASRAVAGEAAKHATMSVHQAHLARHALAHLLGERAQIRRYLSQAIPLLSDYCNKHDIKLNKLTNQTCSTLSLASLCFDLALEISPNTSIQPMYCSSDTLGEELAQYVLTRVNNKNILKYDRMFPSTSTAFDASTTALSAIPPLETTETDDLLSKTLGLFQSTGKQKHNLELFSCSKCVGDVLVI